MKIFLIIILLSTFKQFCNDSEFTIQKKVNSPNNDSSSKTKEKIVRTSGDILKLDTNLTEISTELRRLLLDTVEECFENDQTCFIANASRQELKNALNELNSFKDKFEENIKIIEKNLTSLKKKFCVVKNNKN